MSPLQFAVAPHAGAWIEILVLCTPPITGVVAPHAGAWIEIRDRLRERQPELSHPMRVRGLK